MKPRLRRNQQHTSTWKSPTRVSPHPKPARHLDRPVPLRPPHPHRSLLHHRHPQQRSPLLPQKHWHSHIRLQQRAHFQWFAADATHGEEVGPHGEGDFAVGAGRDGRGGGVDGAENFRGGRAVGGGWEGEEEGEGEGGVGGVGDGEGVGVGRHEGW